MRKSGGLKRCGWNGKMTVQTRAKFQEIDGRSGGGEHVVNRCACWNKGVGVREPDEWLLKVIHVDYASSFNSSAV